MLLLNILFLELVAAAGYCTAVLLQGPIATLPEVCEDPQLRANNAFQVTNWQSLARLLPRERSTLPRLLPPFSSLLFSLSCLMSHVERADISRYLILGR